jgi:Uma2 family endonuclease
MSTVQTQPMTAEEFWEWAEKPENQDRLYELDEGEPVEMPSPGELHGAICALVTHLLWAYVFRRGAGYVCGNDTGLLVKRGPDTIRGPDVMLFGESRRLEDLSRKFATGIPLLVVEVLSPHDQMSKVNLRLSQYLERGVRLVWLVDPETRVVTVYQADRFHRVFDETDELTGNGVLADFRCRVIDLFTLPGEAAAQPPSPKQP